MRCGHDRLADPLNLISARPCLRQRFFAGAGSVRRLRREATVSQSRFPMLFSDFALSRDAVLGRALYAHANRRVTFLKND